MIYTDSHKVEFLTYTELDDNRYDIYARLIDDPECYYYSVTVTKKELSDKSYVERKIIDKHMRCKLDTNTKKYIPWYKKLKKNNKPKSVLLDDELKFEILSIDDNIEMRSYYIKGKELNTSTMVEISVPYLYRYRESYIRDLFISRFRQKEYNDNVEELKGKVAVGKII